MKILMKILSIFSFCLLFIVIGLYVSAAITLAGTTVTVTKDETVQFVADRYPENVENAILLFESAIDSEFWEENKSFTFRPIKLNDEEYKIFLSYVIMNYGYDCLTDCFSRRTFAGNKYSFIINSNIEQYVERRDTVDKKIDEIIETFEDGSDFKLCNQISEYLADNTVYDIELSEAHNVILEGKGNCNAYSKAFKLIADRLGLDCDVEIGTTETGGAHAWNIVTISGNVYWFDVTWYDDSRNGIYLGNSECWHNAENTNNYFK